MAIDSYKKVHSLALVILPILSQYEYINIPLGFILFLLVSVPFIFSRFSELNVDNTWIVYVFLFVITKVFYSNLEGITDLIPVRLLIFTLILMIAQTTFNLELVMAQMSGVVALCIIIYFVQELQYLFTNSRMIPLVPFLKPNMVGEDYSSMIQRLSEHDRSSSLFLEPSYFAEYLVFALIVLQHNYKKYKRYIYVIVLCLIFLRSGLGLVMLTFLTFLTVRRLNTKRALSVIIVAVCCLPLVNFVVGDFGLGRSQELLDTSVYSSGFVRMLRGYLLLNWYTWYEWLLGFNSPYLLQERILGSELAGLYGNDDMSFNGFQSTLLYSGIVGVMLVYYPLIRQIRKSANSVFTVSAFIITSLMAATFLSPIMLLYFVLMKHKPIGKSR